MLKPNAIVTSMGDLFSGAVDQSQVIEDVPVEPAQERLIEVHCHSTKISFVMWEYIHTIYPQNVSCDEKYIL